MRKKDSPPFSLQRRLSGPHRGLVPDRVRPGFFENSLIQAVKAGVAHCRRLVAETQSPALARLGRRALAYPTKTRALAGRDVRGETRNARPRPQVELMTTRLAHHSTSDDASKYRSLDELKQLSSGARARSASLSLFSLFLSLSLARTLGVSFSLFLSFLSFLGRNATTPCLSRLESHSPPLSFSSSSNSKSCSSRRHPVERLRAYIVRRGWWTASNDSIDSCVSFLKLVSRSRFHSFRCGHDGECVWKAVVKMSRSSSRDTFERLDSAVPTLEIQIRKSESILSLGFRWWSDKDETETRAAERAAVRNALDAAESAPKPHYHTLFDDVFDTLSPSLAAQRASLDEHLEKPTGN